MRKRFCHDEAARNQAKPIKRIPGSQYAGSVEGGIMKKTGTVARLVLTVVMTCSATMAAAGTRAASNADETSSAVAASIAVHAAPSSKAKPISAKKKFRYLDMVERKHPSSIRNAVIVYDHLQMRKKGCDAKDPASVSECLGRPSV